MKRFFKRATAILCIMLMLVPSVVCMGDTKSELEEAKRQQEELEKKKKALEGTIAELKKDIKNTAEYMAKLDEQMDILADEIAHLNVLIEEKNGEIIVTTGRLEQAQITEKEQYEAMKQRIKYMYENGTESYFDALITASSISDLLNKAEYASKVSEYDRTKLEEYIAIKEGIAADKAQLEKEELELQTLKTQVEGEQEAVELILTAKQEEMSKLEADSKAYAEKQKELEKENEKLDALIEELTKKYNEEELRKANAKATKEKLFAKELLLWPCPSSYTISSHFSASRLDPLTGSYYAAHKGTDIAAPTGTPVVAAAAGLVTAAGYSASMGNYIVISHGDGITTRYYHNSSLAVSAGQAVTAKQVISYVGSTGWSTGPHLHFEVRVDGTPYDPMQFY